MYDEKKRKQFFSIMRRTFFENQRTKRLIERPHFLGTMWIEMKIKGILMSWFWISLHQGTLSILYSRIQGYMLSFHQWSRSVIVASAMCFVWDAKPFFPRIGIRARFSISCLYNMWLGFRIKENHFFVLFSAVVFSA